MNEGTRSRFGNLGMRLLLMLCGSIFATELLIMLLLDRIPQLSQWGEALLDAALISISVYPILYCLVLRPLRLQTAKRQQTETALRQSEERYRAVSDSALEAIITANRDGNIVDWNPSAERVFGYTKSEALGQPVTRLMPPRYRERHTEGIRRAVAGGAKRAIGKTLELAALRKDGSEFPVELSLTDWQTDGGHFFTAFLRDITERKRAEKDMENLARFPEEHPNPILRVCREGLLLYSNRAAAAELGRERSRIGERVSPEFHEITLHALKTGLPEVVDTTEAEQVYSWCVAPIVEADYVNL